MNSERSKLGNQEFSMMVERKAVISIEAVLTIFGTREALVIPGIVLISKKYNPSSERI